LGGEKQKFCGQACFKASLRRTVRPEKEELQQLVNTCPFLQIAERFHVTDNTIRKWVKFYGLTYPKYRKGLPRNVDVSLGLWPRSKALPRHGREDGALPSWPTTLSCNLQLKVATSVSVPFGAGASRDSPEGFGGEALRSKAQTCRRHTTSRLARGAAHKGQGD
jgi:hypothetical protein